MSNAYRTHDDTQVIIFSVKLSMEHNIALPHVFEASACVAEIEPDVVFVLVAFGSILTVERFAH